MEKVVIDAELSDDEGNQPVLQNVQNASSEPRTNEDTEQSIKGPSITITGIQLSALASEETTSGGIPMQEEKREATRDSDDENVWMESTKYLATAGLRRTSESQRNMAKFHGLHDGAEVDNFLRSSTVRQKALGTNLGQDWENRERRNAAAEASLEPLNPGTPVWITVPRDKLKTMSLRNFPGVVMMEDHRCTQFYHIRTVHGDLETHITRRSLDVMNVGCSLYKPTAELFQKRDVDRVAITTFWNKITSGPPSFMQTAQKGRSSLLNQRSIYDVSESESVAGRALHRSRKHKSPRYIHKPRSFAKDAHKYVLQQIRNAQESQKEVRDGGLKWDSRKKVAQELVRLWLWSVHCREDVVAWITSKMRKAVHNPDATEQEGMRVNLMTRSRRMNAKPLCKQR
ncbi:MAG: hypothetical protein Q7U84_01905 [Polynucleobacter sp.]|nr:hypothetical protein [Polynucleobacter sp.]